MSEPRVIVTGGRKYDDHRTIRRVLALLAPDVVLVHGDAPGADRIARDYWRTIGHFDEPHPAGWGQYGKAAGLVRNSEMAHLGASLCIAFPGGTGTEDMVSKARGRGIPVLRVEGEAW